MHSKKEFHENAICSIYQRENSAREKHYKKEWNNKTRVSPEFHNACDVMHNAVLNYIQYRYL